MKPAQNSQLLMEQPGFVVDTAQQHAVALLDDLFERLVKVQSTIWWSGLFSQHGLPSMLGAGSD